MTALKITEATDPRDSYEEPAETALRSRLGLRPIVYLSDDNSADPRPCPSWCWVGQSNGEYEHEVDRMHPTEATHHYEVNPSLLASQYGGDPRTGNGADLVRTASWELSLDQIGQREPLVKLYLRHVTRKRDADGKYYYAHHFEERGRFSIEDARELVTVLQHLIGLTEA